MRSAAAICCCLNDVQPSTRAPAIHVLASLDLLAPALLSLRLALDTAAAALLAILGQMAHAKVRTSTEIVQHVCQT